MNVLYMIRHGQASFGMPNYDVLSSTGEAQARALAKDWLDRSVRIDALYSGAMKRHRQTVQPLAESGASDMIPSAFEIHEEFNEFDAETVWKNQIEVMVREDPAVEKDLAEIFENRGAFERLFRAAMLRWVSDDLDPEIKPSWRGFTSRVRSGLSKIMDRSGEGQRVAVFTSAGPIAASIQAALDLDDVKAMELSFITLNASVTTFKFSEGKLRLLGFNNVSHLEDSLVTDR